LRPNPTTSFEARGEPGGTDSLVSIGVQWPLDLFRRSGRVATADQQVAASQAGAADRERVLVSDVRRQYGRAAAAIRAAGVASVLAATVERQLALVRGRVDEGAAPRLDRELLEVEWRRLQAARAIAEGRAEREVLAIKPLLGMTADEVLILRDPLDVLVQDGEGRRSEPATSVAERPDVRMAALQVAVAAAGVDQARREGRIDLSLVGSYMRMDAGFPQLGLSSAGAPERVRGQFNYILGGVVVALPLMDRQQGRVTAARAEQAAADARRAATELAARGEVEAAEVRDRSARRALEAYGAEARDLAKHNLDVVRQTFELGRGTVQDVLIEQRRYLEFEQGYTDTLLEAWEAQADLVRAKGEWK